MKTASLLRRIEALERRLSSVEQERITVLIERRDSETGKGGPDSVVLIHPSQRPQAIQRGPSESYEAFRVRANL